MVYIDEKELGWRPMFETWISNENFKWKQETKEYVANLFNTYVDPCLKYVAKNLVEAMPQVNLCGYFILITHFISYIMNWINRSQKLQRCLVMFFKFIVTNQ